MSVKGIRKAFTDASGAEHPEGLHVINFVNVDRRGRIVSTQFICYHDELAYDTCKAIVQRHPWTATEVEDLNAGNFDELMDFIYGAALTSDEFLQGGELVDSADVSPDDT